MKIIFFFSFFFVVVKSGRAIDILGEIISRPQFRHWEIHDALPRLTFDLDVYDEKPELSKNKHKRNKPYFQLKKKDLTFIFYYHIKNK